MFFDPVYMLIMLVGMALIFGAQAMVKGSFNKYSQVPAARGLTGADVARYILGQNGLGDVEVFVAPGVLSDHYDPMKKRIGLSEENYYGRSVAGITVAAHECGHAIQHAEGYFPVVLRSALAPVFGLGSSIGPLLIMVAIGLGAASQVMPDWAWTLAWFGVAFYGAAVMFHVVTLPVELDASSRALAVLSGSNYLAETEMPGARKVLRAAAFTYVATALYALMELMYWVWRLLGSRRD